MARKGRVLLVLTGVLLVAATVVAYADRVLFDSDRFADRAAATLRDAGVREAVSDRVADQLVAAEPDLIAARPIVVSAVSGVVGGNVFASLLRGGVRDVHAAVFRRDQDTVTLTLVDAGIVVAAALRQVAPEVAADIDRDRRVSLVKRDVGAATSDLVRLARDVEVLAWVLAVLTLAAGAAAIALGGDRRRAVAGLGLTIAIAGVIVVAGETIARGIVLDGFEEPDAHAAATGVWNAFVGDLRSWGWFLGAVGAIVAAAASSLLRPVDVERPLRAAWQRVTTEPESTPLRVARGAGLIVAGVVLVAEPAAVVRIAATLAGVYVISEGVEALLRLISVPVERPAAERAPREPRRRRRLVVPLAAAVLVGLVVVAFVGGGGVDEPAPEVTACNGHAALCDRPLDEVTLATTHNAMSAPLPGWFSSLQEQPIRRQLEDGVRGLLFDTHYADKLESGRTRTAFASSEEEEQALTQDGPSERAVEAAKRLRERLGFRGEGERGMYLCHAFCELGATPLADVLDDIHEFLATHPGEVVVVVNQDYVTPRDFVAAADAAGLGPYAFTPPARGASWPTLRELIDRGRRFVVLAENEAGAAPWYQPAYERLTQETPFEFRGTAALTSPEQRARSCRPNRGTTAAPLFLVNHWVNTDPVPLPSNAGIVNAYEPLLARARECARMRERHVNLLAVDFYGRGDLLRVVDALNGV
jgi:hypothetical protein